MVIVHLITRWLKAGSEENTLQTCRAQRAEGRRVILAYGREHDPASAARAADHVETVCVRNLVHPISPTSDVRAVLELVRLFRSLRADVVHTHQSKAGILGRVAARLAGVPVVVHGVHILPWMHVGRAQRAIYLAAERACAPLTDAFVNVSPGVRDEGISRGVGQASRHFVAYSGMDVDRFQDARPPEDWRVLLGVDPASATPIVLFMLAAFEPRKRQAQLLEAIAAGLAARPQVRLLFAGDGPELAVVKARTAALGLAGQVRFAGHRADPERLVALADVCLLTSEREGLPRVLVQYAAAAKPIVTTRLPGIEDIVLPGVSALVCETPADVAAAALGLADDPARRAALSAEASRIDVERWSPERMAAAMGQAYAAAIARAGRRRGGRAILLPEGAG